jgi:hypothetical protein
VTNDFSHLWNQHIKPLLATPGTINAADNPVDWTKLKSVPAGFADGLDNGVDKAGFGLKKSIVIGGGMEFAIDATKVQRRVTGTCPAGQALAGVAENGLVTCSPGPKGYSVGPSDTGIICNDWCVEGSLQLPAGTYAVTAKIVADQKMDAEYPTVEVDCRLDFGPTTADATEAFVYADYSPEVPMTLIGIGTVSSTDNISLVCRDHDMGDVSGRMMKMVAIRLA